MLKSGVGIPSATTPAIAVAAAGTATATTARWIARATSMPAAGTTT